MEHHDFFTRMISINCTGSNAQTTLEHNKKPKKVYFCGVCEASHDSKFSAEECCRPEVYSEYECPVCSESYGDENEALSCCTSGQPKRCPVCMKPAESYEYAADCCLHTHPSMSAAGRERVAKAVEGGMSWPDAVAANIHH